MEVSVDLFVCFAAEDLQLKKRLRGSERERDRERVSNLKNPR
jgi:hypothetical protein